MKTSSETDKIYPAVIAMQHSLEAIERSKEVKTGKYSFKYAPLDAIMDKVKPLFASNGLAVMQGVDADVLTTRLIHQSGQWVESETHLNREHANMQGFGGEVTFKRRYALSALIGLVSDDDNDAPAGAEDWRTVQHWGRPSRRLEDLPWRPCRRMQHACEPWPRHRGTQPD
jgi:hypothetical protein